MELRNVCLYENFRGTAEDMAAVKARCGCTHCTTISPGLWLEEETGTEKLKKLFEEDIRKMEKICDECGEQAITLIDGVCNTCTSKKDDNDIVDYPKHYNTGKIQPIDVIEDWGLDFRLANAVKYIARHNHKGSANKDLEKAIWYIQRYIDKELNKEAK